MKKNFIKRPVVSPKKKRNISQTFIKKVKMVMHLAWKFIKENAMSLAEAMKLAWKNVKLNNKLHSSISVSFTFKKKNGEIRQAIGTLVGDVIPNFDITSWFIRKTKDGNQAYYDLEVGAWRSFICANLVSIN